MATEDAIPKRGVDGTAIIDGRWTNWGSNQQASPRRFLRPTTEQEIVDLVTSASSEGGTIRPLGSGHSFSALVPTDDTILDLGALTGIRSVDRDRKRVVLGAGTKLFEIGDALWEYGLALANQGDIDKQTIAGATATGTHGSGIRYGSFSSAVTALRLIDGMGKVRELDERDIEQLRASQVHLGMLGVVTEVELQVVDAYYLEEEITYPTWSEMQQTLHSDVVDYRHFSYLWLPHSESAALYELTPPDASIPDLCYRKRYREASISDSEIVTTPDERIDRSYRIYPGSFDLNFHELEYFVPATDADSAAEAVRSLMRNVHPEQKYPLEVRWVKGDSAYLSPTGGVDVISLSVSGAPGTDYEPYLRDIHNVLKPFGARPHWGKLHYFDAPQIKELFPKLPEFLALRKEFDPREIFLNQHLRALFLQ